MEFARGGAGDESTATRARGTVRAGLGESDRTVYDMRGGESPPSIDRGGEGDLMDRACLIGMISQMYRGGG